mmetsp:Transcript_9154/g.14865  ORF Transcript_9154/g.14865 Transcript_9154/m.14865 type:complete len:212 (+) Transcript_9154:46-681(+)
MTGKLVAPVKWAQRKEELYITIDLPDVEKDTCKIDLSEDKLKFTGKSQDKEYELELVFWKEGNGVDIDPEKSKYKVKPRNIEFLLSKKEEGFWPRLLEDKTLQRTNVKVDFDKWVDSDDEGQDEGFQNEGMDNIGGMMGGGPPGMGGMGGMPGMGGAGGMDMEALMKQMQGMGGAGGLDPAMMEKLGAMGGAGGDDEGGDSDDDLPDLEDE